MSSIADAGVVTVFDTASLSAFFRWASRASTRWDCLIDLEGFEDSLFAFSREGNLRKTGLNPPGIRLSSTVAGREVTQKRLSKILELNSSPGINYKSDPFSDVCHLLHRILELNFSPGMTYKWPRILESRKARILCYLYYTEYAGRV